MSATMIARPYQVGDRVRITDHGTHNLHPDAQYVHEGIVAEIDPPSEPDSEYTFGPYLWAETESYTSPSGEVFDRVFCAMTDDMTDALHPEVTRSIELLEPAPSDDTTPSLVAMDRTGSEARVLKAAMAWDDAMAGDGSTLDAAEDALRYAIRDYREVTR